MQERKRSEVIFNVTPPGLKLLRVSSGCREPADTVTLHWLQANTDGQTDHNTVTKPDERSGVLVKAQPAGAISSN